MPRPDPPPLVEELTLSACVRYAWRIGREKSPPGKYLVCEAKLIIERRVVKEARAIWMAVQRPAPGKWKPFAIDPPVIGDGWPEIPVDYPPRTRAISKVRHVEKELP